MAMRAAAWYAARRFRQRRSRKPPRHVDARCQLYVMVRRAVRQVPRTARSQDAVADVVPFADSGGSAAAANEDARRQRREALTRAIDFSLTHAATRCRVSAIGAARLAATPPPPMPLLSPFRFSFFIFDCFR